MDHSLTEDEINTIVSSLRRGIPIREAERKEFARKTRFFLKDAQSYRQTCEFLAQKCLDEMAKVNWETDDTWKSGVVEEIQWWWTWINRLRENGDLQKWENFKLAAFPFETYVSAFGDAPIRCLNIGSGPRSIVGQKTASPSLEVVNVDPLAPAYNALMSFLDAPGGGDIVFGAVEVIDEIDLGKFQFISAQNCLDHAYDVPEGLERLINVLDDKGVIKLEHYLNEAVAQNYLGFHKWNIEIVDGKIHMWSKTESHKFDHEARGFALKYEERAVKKGSGADHTMLTIHLERGL